MNKTTALKLSKLGSAWLAVWPGVAFSILIAASAYALAPLLSKYVPLPTMVVALLLGIAMSPIGGHTAMTPGLSLCIKTILRWSVALLGLRVALADIIALGLNSALITLAAMVITVVCGFVLSRWTKQPIGFGAMIGVGTAVCGASATLAVSAVVPHYENKQTDIVLVVVALNALATVAMVTYPLLCISLGFDPHTTGVILGATIHDVAQVAGAGYAISAEVGNTAVVVKLFRVFLLLPTVIAVGIYFSRLGLKHGEARVPVPDFAIVFLLLCVINSAIPWFPELEGGYRVARLYLIEASNWGLLISISALGLGTSLKRMTSLSWRHVSTIVATTMIILAVVLASELLLR